MDRERFEGVVRLLGTTPSRRAVNRALLGLMAGSFFVPLIDSATGLAKRGRRHKKKKRKKKELCLESHNGTCHKCEPQDTYCPIRDYGIVPRCCSWEKRELCTSCGCCPEDFTLCCVSSSAKTCCHKDGECCGEDHCCLPGETCCNGEGCCGPGEECYRSTGANPFNYCCAEGLTCKPSGGPTCVQK
jgi:hypothetical protein